MQQEYLSKYKCGLKSILEEQLQIIRNQVDVKINSFQTEVEYLIDMKIKKLKLLKNHLSDDFDEHLQNLMQQFQQGIQELGNEVNISISQTFQSNTLSTYFNNCIKTINKDKMEFDVYRFKHYNYIQPDKIQPINESINQIYVLNKQLIALIYQSSQQIQIIDSYKYCIVRTISTPFIKNIISSNSVSSTLSLKTDREIVTINYHTQKIVRMFVVNNAIDEMICACQLSKFIFAYATNFGRIWITDITNGEIITKLDGEIPSILYKFNNKYLIAAGITRGISLWNWRKNIVEQRFIGHNSRVNSVIKYDSDHIISCDQSGKIYMFKIQTSVRCKQFIGHNKPVVRVIKLNNEYIASCGFDKTIRIWIVESEVCFRTLEKHDNFVLDIAKFGQNKMVSTCQDKVLSIWG